MKGKRWIFMKEFEGMPKETDVKLVNFDVPDIKDGEVLLEALFLSVDPYMRIAALQGPIGSCMVGEQLAIAFGFKARRWGRAKAIGDFGTLGGGILTRVTKSKNTAFPIGTLVLVNSGWTTHSVSDGANLTVIEDFPPDLPLSSTLGTIGMPGFTAMYGTTHVLQIKPGDVVLVNGAAGAVGNVVGQLAKNTGCKVIGFAGSDAKVQLLKDLGFDVAINYKTVVDLDETLTTVAPNGVDCFFDNVGGEFASVVIRHMKHKGRIVCCGSISEYNTEKQKVNPGMETPYLDPDWTTTLLRAGRQPMYKQAIISGTGPRDYDKDGQFTFRELRMEGISMFNHLSIFPELRKRNIELVKQGKLKIIEDVTDGFDNMYEAFLGLFSGKNIGKAVVKA